MKKNYLQKMVAALLTAALLVGVIPVGALATEAESPGTEDFYEEALQYTPQDILQAGVSDVTANVEGSRTREELLALDSVVLSEDGEPVAIRGTEDNITVEEMNILFSRPANYALRGESDPNQELREKFGLTDADIELGSSLHGSRLTYTTELGNLAVKAEYMNISETQMAELADLISSGYSCYHAMRALVAKDLIGFTLDELKTARQQEIQAEEQEGTEETELADQEETEEPDSPNIVGLPTFLAERAV